jgi:HD-GYP domain-containing protein (c-di-GMP phosphodiesterase class II)
MTSPRPYRHALTYERAIVELGSCAGTQFDPELTELFVDVWSGQADAVAS